MQLAALIKKLPIGIKFHNIGKGLTNDTFDRGYW